MKKLFCILLFCLPLLILASPKVFKTGSRPRLQYGAQAGANLNYFMYRNGLQKDVSAGYQGGLFMRVSRKKIFAQFEVNVMNSTVSITNGIFNNQFSNNSYENLKFRYNTIGIPLILGGYAVKKPLYKVRLYSGVEAQFITKANVFIQQNNKDFYRLKREEKRDILRPAQISYMMGSGMDIAMFIFDIKYSVNMTSFFKENYRTQTNLFQFTVGVIF
jgi:hypothetical protein